MTVTVFHRGGRHRIWVLLFFRPLLLVPTSRSLRLLFVAFLCFFRGPEMQNAALDHNRSYSGVAARERL